MIVALADVYAQIPHRKAIQEVMLRTEARVREDPGCVSFVFAEVLAEPGHFILVQRWRDKAALNVHYRSTAFADYQAGIRGLLVRDSEIRVYVSEQEFRPVDSSGLDIGQDD
jgi:quinol monooxygenase YgiN